MRDGADEVRGCSCEVGKQTLPLPYTAFQPPLSRVSTSRQIKLLALFLETRSFPPESRVLLLYFRKSSAAGTPAVRDVPALASRTALLLAATVSASRAHFSEQSDHPTHSTRWEFRKPRVALVIISEDPLQHRDEALHLIGHHYSVFLGLISGSPSIYRCCYVPSRERVRRSLGPFVLRRCRSCLGILTGAAIAVARSTKTWHIAFRVHLCVQSDFLLNVCEPLFCRVKLSAQTSGGFRKWLAFPAVSNIEIPTASSRELRK